VSDNRLNCISCHGDGALLAVGDEGGNARVIEMNDWFVTPGPFDRARLTAVSFVVIILSININDN